MKKIWLLLLLLKSFLILGQNTIDWDSKYELTLSDFQSTGTQTDANITSIQSGANIQFGFQMNAMQFLFTKNFNSKVSCVFNKNGALILSPNIETAQKLVRYGQYQFDLCELYARKLRKNLYESKNVSSDPNFYKSVNDQVQNEMVQRQAIAGKLSNLGIETNKLEELHTEVLNEIETYADFCKTCKPSKKKK